MFELFKLLFGTVLHGDLAAAAERASYTSHLAARVDPEAEVEPSAEIEAALLSEVEASVKRRLVEPDSARIEDCSIYSDGLGGYAVCGRVTSRTVAGTDAVNFFIVETDGQPKVLGCEMFTEDPRDRAARTTG